ncbi:sulfotransferase family 2 domain-containing protein [Caballeronia udeis]|uniref:sulfotransferase family 2 domain-containing protein n=1 Tax=Caballeronia udeis TaxID=1232866 RepID=UPI00384C78DF
MSNPVYYLHIPKTGGSSLISYLDSQFDPDEVCPSQLLPDLFQLPANVLRQYRFFRGHLWYGLSSYLKRDLTYLTMLRDPVQRTISWYSHVKRDVNAYRHQRVIDENWTLQDFVLDRETNWDMVNAQTLFLAVDLDYSKLAHDPVGYGRTVVKQYAQRSNDRSLLEIAKRRIEEFAFFGITERMQDSMCLLSYVMDFCPDPSTPRLNISSDRPSDQDVSPETIDAIREITRLDQELYDWACQIFEERFREMAKALVISRYESNHQKPAAPPCGPLPAEERLLFRIEIVRAPAKINTTEKFQMTVGISNNSRHTINTRLKNPVNISYHWIEASNGSIAIFDGERTKISPGLSPGEKEEFSVLVESPIKAGRYVLRVTMVQEGVAWFDEGESPVFSDIEMIVGTAGEPLEHLR